jgi:hypothetical protein
VDGDPTADILATRKILRVWKSGREMDRQAFSREIQGARNRPAIELDAGVLRACAGRYDFGQQTIFTLSFKDNRLFLDLPNGRSIPLQAASPTDFYSKEVGVELRFERNSEGAVASLFIKQGDQERRGRRLE